MLKPTAPLNALTVVVACPPHSPAPAHGGGGTRTKNCCTGWTAVTAAWNTN